MYIWRLALTVSQPNLVLVRRRDHRRKVPGSDSLHASTSFALGYRYCFLMWRGCRPPSLSLRAETPVSKFTLVLDESLLLLTLKRHFCVLSEQRSALDPM
ncbi:unnamed protein product [Mycena citricolor]|uniref:Uncharacterized protein n=1 Tax=Mycena citricolor TaxID=2018698 RepID=A0AAD2H9J2_9AGAR|nr:unnamed protein product [Mycena citricolor]